MATARFSGEILLLLFCMSVVAMVESGIGVNWGTLALHRLSPETVVDLLKDNKISKVKLFDADPSSMRALMGSGIEVMVGIPNEMLALLGASTSASDLWVAQNVSSYMVKGGVNIKYFFIPVFLVALSDFRICFFCCEWFLSQCLVSFIAL